MKTILVTGSNGLLGQKITEKIIANNQFHLVATSRGANRFLSQKGYIYESMDILDPLNVKAVIEKYQPDAIIHTAAMTNVDTCEANQEMAHALNVGAVKTLLSICEAQQIQFIHLSTDFIFDGAAGPYDESAIPNPLSYYGETKVEAEELVKNALCPWVIIRTILVYGVLADMSRSNIVLWAKTALEKGEAIDVVNDQWRMPTLAEDLADGCLLAVDKGAQGVFNVCGKDMMSIVELVKRVAAYWSLDTGLIREVSSDSLNQNARRPAKTGFILDKAIAELGYQPHSFEEGITMLVKQINDIEKHKMRVS